MKSYQFGVAWIARNDNAGNGDTEKEIAEYISVLLLADLSGKTEADVAADVFKIRDTERRAAANAIARAEMNARIYGAKP